MTHEAVILGLSLTVDPLGSLRNHALEYGIELSSAQLERFSVYLKELMLWNRSMNLTGLRSAERVVIDLFLDSLIPLPLMPPEGPLLDVGSGAGVPGLPIKIVQAQLEVHLLEAKAKRVSFLKHVIRLMGLHRIQVFCGRIEEESTSLPCDLYPAVTVRAFAPLPHTLTCCAPRLAKGGLLFCFLGRHVQRAMEESRGILEREGLKVFETVSYRLPGKQEMRHAVVFKKEGGPLTLDALAGC